MSERRRISLPFRWPRVLAWRSGSGIEVGTEAAGEPKASFERPGTDDQWSELVDAMRRYRRHKQRARRRGRLRGGHRAV